MAESVHFIRSGYAWVGVTPQRVGVDALEVWNPKRYGSLDVTHGGAVMNDDLSYDVFAQAALAGLYPTHESDVRAVRDVTAWSLQAGCILEIDADETIAQAERSDIGGRTTSSR